jgi:hypothetical protein
MTAGMKRRQRLVRPRGKRLKDGSILGCRAGAAVPPFSRRQEDGSKGSAFAGWFHPLRRSGIMVTRSLLGFEARALIMMVAGEGLEPP